MDFEKYDWVISNLKPFSLNLLAAFVILVGGFWVTTIISNFIKKRMIARELEPSIREFISPIINIGLKLLVILTAVSTVGIQITSFAAILGGIAIGVGMALQGSLANLAGGILIIIFKPFKIGDTIDSQGNVGKVESISILYTTIVTSDKKIIIMPNAGVFNNPVTNYSRSPLRRIDIKIGIAYDNSFKKVEELILQILQNEPLVVKNEPFSVEITDFTPGGILLSIRSYVKTKDYWTAFSNLTKEIKHLLEEQKIMITSPTNEIHIIKKNSDV